MDQSGIDRLNQAMAIAVEVAQKLPDKFQGKAFELIASFLLGVAGALPVTAGTMVQAGQTVGVAGEWKARLSRLTLPEWAKIVRPRSGAEYAVTIAAYAQYHDESSLTLDYFRHALSKLGKRFANLSDVLIKAERGGWLYKKDESRYLTSTAEEWIRTRIKDERDHTIAARIGDVITSHKP